MKCVSNLEALCQLLRQFGRPDAAQRLEHDPPTGRRRQPGFEPDMPYVRGTISQLIWYMVQPENSELGFWSVVDEEASRRFMATDLVTLDLGDGMRQIVKHRRGSAGIFETTTSDDQQPPW